MSYKMEDKYFVVQFIITPAGHRVKARVPKKLTPEEKEKVHKELLEDIKKIAEISRHHKPA